MRRLITAIALIVVAAYLIGWAPGPVFIGAALLMGLLCYREYSGLVAAHGIPRSGLLGLAAGVSIIFWPQQALPIASVLFVCAFLAALRLNNLRDVLPAVACEFLGAFYAFAPWRFSIDLRAESRHLLFFALALNWIGDSAAYYAGRAFGKHRMAPLVSPKKSWEGAIASILGSLLFGIIYLRYAGQGAWWQAAILAVVGNIAGQLGDLAESAIKRGGGVKDSGTFLPGHGGMLDRVDSSLFTLPVVYLLNKMLMGIR
jgi:phosphatidate cytidylyltransferase